MPGRPVTAWAGLAGSAGRVGVVDLLLAEGLADLVDLGDGLGTEPDTLDRGGLLDRNGTLGVQRDLLLLLADVTAGGRLAAVGAGDRLPLEADFLVADRDGLGDGLGDDVLAPPRPAHFGVFGADVQPLLRPGH